MKISLLVILLLAVAAFSRNPSQTAAESPLLTVSDDIKEEVIDTDLSPLPQRAGPRPRPELLEKRLTKIQEIEKSLKACYRTQCEALKEEAIKELYAEAQPDKEYSFIVKEFLTIATLKIN